MFKLHYPVKKRMITQGFGKAETSPAMLATYQAMGLEGHNGLDFMAFDGTPIYASHDGRVTFTGYDGSGGLGVVIRTNEPDEKGLYYKTIYWHLQKDSIVVTGSQQVKAGDLIGLADNTGLSTGAHLHFGLKPIAKGENDWTWDNVEQNNGYKGAIDPRPFFLKFGDEMQLGEQSQNVRDLQDFLHGLGYFNVPGTGFYGSITSKAVLAFQIDHCNLSWYERYIMKGSKVGPKTLEALNLAYK